MGILRHPRQGSARVVALRLCAGVRQVREPYRLRSPAQDATPYGPQSGYPGYRPSNAATPYEGVAIRFVAILIDTIIIGVISSILTAPFFALSITRLATRAISPADTHATRLAGPRYWNHKQATM